MRVDNDFNRRLDRLQRSINKQTQLITQEVEFISNGVRCVLSSLIESIITKLLTICYNFEDIRLSVACHLDRIKEEMLEMENLKQKFEETKKMIYLLETVTTSPKCYLMEEGVLDWCITNFRAQRDHNECISMPFTTSKYGYKFLLSVYPNGYRAGSGTHLSVQIAIMSGNFDELLPWPFCHPITIRLINQLRNGNCIEVVIRAPSFNRPTTCVNQTLCFHHFNDLGSLFDETIGFLVQDTLIFQVSLDTNDPADACKMVDVENGCKNLHTVVVQARN